MKHQFGSESQPVPLNHKLKSGYGTFSREPCSVSNNLRRCHTVYTVYNRGKRHFMVFY